MGWDSWNAFGPKISDSLIRAEAAAMASSGMQAAGYTYVNIDDGWQGARDQNGNIQPNSNFPDMVALAKYVHSLGLKIGIYSSPGPKTCSGNVGSFGHEKQDAATFASWGMDLLRYEWCSCTPKLCGSMRDAFLRMSNYLDHTQLVYQISGYGAQEPWTWAPEIGANAWATGGNTEDEFYCMTELSFVNDSGLGKFAGPTVAQFGGVTNGGWNDPGTLEVGSGGETTEEYKTQMSIWAILAAPLTAGNDLTHMSQATLRLLANPDITAVDQDALGIQGHRVWQHGPEDIWIKPMSDKSIVVGVFNHGGFTDRIALPFHAIGITGQADAYDLWAHKDLGLISNGYEVAALSGGARMLKLTPEKRR